MPKNKQVKQSPATPEFKIPAIPAEPKKRGRPRKNPVTDAPATRRNDNVDTKDFIVKHLEKVVKHSLPMVTPNNGFIRGLKPDAVLAAFRNEANYYFAVKFKNRKQPEIIDGAELRLRAPALMLNYYFSNLKIENNKFIIDLSLITKRSKK
ncbi:maker42 [Drosophila busckii]|uniref:Maker42 n=1 Tax=Drosophila busckii TaxID=30019 RepID=A0A0M3QUS1_DROBS|nr:uncharacterized protein LOC108595866 [Drosophila busckii]ALC41123.1 maker42 [Drosophila busckii]